jgi:hypothetical protein
VRSLVMRGDLSVDPAALQDFLENDRNGSNSSKGKR